MWVETSVEGEVEVAGRTAPTFRIGSHHYGIVDLDPDGLDAPGGSYTVRLDGRTVWPLDDGPTAPPLVNPWSGRLPITVMAGSCRQQAPDPLWRHDARSGFGDLGPDALATLSREIQRGLRTPPDLLLLTGDQVYADEQHRSVRAALRRRRGGPPSSDRPDVTSFDEYAWLYQRTWGHPLIRWLLSSVPTLMVFDDHDVIDDWNISDRWIEDMAAVPWWKDRIVSGLASYWVYQHLGNLSPAEREVDEVWQAVRSCEDGRDVLFDHARRLALDPEQRVHRPWSYEHRAGELHVVVLDSRNARVLEPSRRSPIGPPDWERLARAVDPAPEDGSPAQHVVIVTSIPWALPSGVHRIQQLVSHLADGGASTLTRPGRWIGERIRRAVDLEHWAAFGESFERLRKLLAASSEREDHPETLVVLSGDVHFAYLADVDLGTGRPAHQVVASPLRQIELRYERAARRLALSRFSRRVLGRLARWSRATDDPVRLRLTDGPFFDNNIATLTYAPDGATARLEVAVPGPTDESRLIEVATREL